MPTMDDEVMYKKAEMRERHAAIGRQIAELQQVQKNLEQSMGQMKAVTHKRKK